MGIVNRIFGKIGENLLTRIVARVGERRFEYDEYKALTKENVKMLHKKGFKINCWTVDDPKAAETLAKWGVDLITSNILE